MQNHLSTMKKIIALPLLVSLLFFSFGTPKAEALVPGLTVPTTDGLSIFEQITQTVAANGFNLAQEAMRISADSVAYAAGQALLNQLTDNTISWIRGGFQGSPSFDINPEKLLTDLADSVAGSTARQIRGLAICDFDPTFKNDLANMVELSTRSDANNKFAAQVQCPFPSLNFSTSGFYSGASNAFQQNGGWQAFEASLSDRGNAFGVAIIANQELIARQQSAQDVQEKKLARSSGFLDIIDTNDCTYPEGQAAFDAIDWTNDPQGRAIYQRMYCNTKTPGKIAGDQLTKALGVNMDKVGFVDNVNKILSTLVTALTQSAVSASRELF